MTGRDERPRLVVICGPTASGKTEGAIRVCEALGGEVVSADAVQIYRGLDIGSAKPTPAERARARHHLIDCIDPTERFSAARFVEAADRAIADIRARSLLPVVAGGTGLYLRALLYGLMPAPAADPALRATLEAEEDARGPGTLHRRLAAVDPEAAARLHPTDRVRLVRALEVYLLTGTPISEHQRAHGFRTPRYRAVLWGVDPGREVLAERIARRVDAMLAAGFLEEVAGLLAAGLSRSDPGLAVPGYRELAAHLAGELSYEDAVLGVVRAHRRYARRQRTWFRKMAGIKWYSGPDALPIEALSSALRATPDPGRGVD